MNKTADCTVALDKGRVDVYTKNGVALYAYQTRDLIDNEVFVLAKKGRGVVIELPCFFDNIRELTDFLKSEGVTVEAKFVAYHAAGASFLPEVPAYGTESSVAYNTTGGGAGLVANFENAFDDSFDPAICEVDHVLEEGEIELAGIRFAVKPNAEAFDLEIPEINCVYTHMMGHDCHSIVAGCPHCGRPMTMNLRCDDKFAEDEGWHAAAERYENFLRTRDGQKILFLELGVGYNTPVIIKYPFLRMTAGNPKATYACINMGQASTLREIEERSILIDGDIAAVIEEMKKTASYK